MKRLQVLALALILLGAGCTSVHITRAYNGVRVDGGRDPAATAEVENSGWFLFTFIPLASGNPEAPNEVSCQFFSDTVTVANNIKVLKGVMRNEHVLEVANLTTHCTDEKYLVFLLSRRAYHTSAVLLKPEPLSTVESNK